MLNSPVFDLPQLYQRPDTVSLLKALNLLQVQPRSFDNNNQQRRTRVHPEGVAEYLTRIVGSSLTWLDSDDDRESVWQLASQRLAERSGRSGMAGFDRSFEVPLPAGSGCINFSIHEPAMTEDNLGLKTWGSSFALAKHLTDLAHHFAHLLPAIGSGEDATTAGQPHGNQARVLELGAGTGVLGLAFAAVFKTHVLMTDLAEIAPNLRRNAEGNTTILSARKAKASVGILDWAQPEALLHVGEYDAGIVRKAIDTSAKKSINSLFDIVIAADPIYSTLHPSLLADTIQYRLSPSKSAKFLVAYPVRAEYQTQIEELHRLMESRCGLSLCTSGQLQGMDDWDIPEQPVVEYKLFVRG